jgi:hypothetical protein
MYVNDSYQFNITGTEYEMCVCNCEPKYCFVSLSVSDAVYTVYLDL